LSGWLSREAPQAEAFLRTVSSLSERAEEVLQVGHEQCRLLHRQEVAASARPW
jgi:hypothetical protein